MKLRMVVGSVVLSWFAVSGAVRAAKPDLRYFIEVSVPSADAARDFAVSGYDVAGFNRNTLMVGLVVTPDELVRVQAMGWPVTIRSSNLDVHAVDALSDYTDPQELSAYMDQVVAAHPDLAAKSTVEETLFEGQKQYVLHITKDVGLDNDRPSFLFDAQHHAREVMTPEIARDFIDYLTTGYATDPQVQRWVDNINIYIVGSVNPDGAMYVFTTDNSWRRNRHPSCGVDNNRNYPVAWGSCNGSTNSCTSDTNRGTAPGSEPENQGMMQLTSSVHPFYTLSYHSYGEYLMYPYGCNDPDERSALDEVAQGLNAILQNDAGVTGQYATGPIWSTIYLADGSSTDTQYNLYGAYSYIIEVNSSNEGFQPDFATWRNVTVQRQRTAWKYFLDKTLDGAQVRGTVTDAGTGLPLAANLSLQEVTFTHGEAQRHADAKGHYHLLVHTGGTYHVAYSYPGYCSSTQEVVVGSGPATVDVVLGRPGVPPAVNAASAGDNAIDVSWQPAANADQYRVLRSLSAGGPYTAIATVPGAQTTFHDTPVSGGATYYYVVRAIQGCESGNSAEVQAATSGPCTVGPAFAGVTSVANAATSTCTLNLTWPSAGTRCGGGVTYRVYRSATSPFTPGPGTLIASGLTGNSFADHGALANAASYAYIVRAVDAGNGADDGNNAAATAVPTGVNTVGTWTDNAGDTGTARLSPSAPWSIKPTGGKTGPNVYATGAYANSACAALTSPALSLQNSSSLTFASKYDIETNYDAGIVEVATGPAYATWSKLSMNYPDSLSFTGNACGIATGGAATAFSRTITTPAYSVSPYTGSLAAFAGKSVKLRWRFSSDAGVTGQGWWVDDVSITNAVIPGTCSAGVTPNPKEASPDGHMTASRSASGTAIDLTYAPGCGTLDHAAYWGTGPIAGALAWMSSACALSNTGQATFDPGDPDPGSFFYFVIVGQNAAKESSYGTDSSGERPEAIGVGACDEPQDLTGTCP
jgi:Zinc carboxypeptidase